MPKAGLTLPTTGVQGSWFLAQYFATGDPGWIVPVQSMTQGQPSLKAHAFATFGKGYPDQELIGAVVGRSIDPKDGNPSRHLDKAVLLGANHGSSVPAWRFITKANNEEKRKQHLYGFPVQLSPPIYPATYSPTGAVHKKNRLGEIDPDNMRPTSDFSWPAAGHWMEWLVDSVNKSIDLDADFPYVRWMAFKDFATQVAALQAWGEPVV
jgi:hypothetical protein